VITEKSFHFFQFYLQWYGVEVSVLDESGSNKLLAGIYAGLWETDSPTTI